MIVRAKEAGEIHPSLTPGQLYYVIGIEADTYRLICDDGDPCLYEPEIFEVVDPSEPEDWVIIMGTEGERYAYPPPLNEVGFFEDYHDRRPQARAVFWRAVNRLMCQVDRKIE